MGRSAGGGFGTVMLVIVMAIVLILAARNWMAVAPVAAEIDPGGGDGRGQAEAGAALRNGQLPGLDDMRDATGDHAARLDDALDSID
jgi:hypothetical protein